MAETNIDYPGWLADLQEKRDMLLRIVQGLDAAIDGLTQFVSGATVPSGTTVYPPSITVMPRPSSGVQSDTFFRMSIGEAAQKFLNISGAPPRSIGAITAALNRGGLKCKPESVATIVGREAKTRGFVKVGGEWGLEEWYIDRKEGEG